MTGKGAYVFIDVSRKQEYIFRNNELRASLYRSFVIKSVTEDLSGDKALKECIHGTLTLNKFLQEKFHQHDYCFKFSGGGNSILYFNRSEDARYFVRNYSLQVQKQFPDLELYISVVEEPDGMDDEAKRPALEKYIREELHRKADKLKDAREGQFRRWTYGIEKIDAAGMPVLKLTEDEKDKKRELEQKIQVKLLDKLAIHSGDGGRKLFTVTKELTDYRKNSPGQDIGKSYIGIIAIDGNQMGKIVNSIETFADLNAFGNWIEKVYYHAVCRALKDIGAADLIVTPVLMAGDDLCLITNAEYALELAHLIVRNIMKLSASPYPDPEDPSSVLPPSISDKLSRLNLHYLSACAGVAITKVTYPFYEAVKAAEDLCKQAKEKIYTLRHDDDSGTMPGFIDWRIVHGQAEPAETYEEMVGNTGVKQVFHIKPLLISREDEPADQPTFDRFNQLVKTLIRALPRDEADFSREPGQGAGISRTELEKVRRAVYNGPDAYEQLFRNDQTGQLKWLRDRVQECFPNLRVHEVAPILTENNTVTYIFHDVLEILPYMREFWTSRYSEGRGVIHESS